ncbi:insulinase family protein [Lampropedia puyangensis]|uniref:Insulinase family protein n=1 Tax=Lampropedia puyangensis TaxID=1330072 RepID=A0A4S8F229_9BURK|nr:pitrilysin family protein [Lampropedia puyangensis]THU01047.1 insulinase family protein [Lampropedia puyangensis]
MKRFTLWGGCVLAASAFLAGCAAPVAPDQRATTTNSTSTTEANPAGASASSVQVLQESATLAHYRLANGLEVIVKPDRRAPTAINMLWVRTGSIDEVDGTTGVAHILEHMMFKGSKHLAAGEFSRKVAELGGQDNAFTNKDYTGYYQQVPSNQLEAVMALEADRFQHNQWPDEEFKRELEVVKEERRMRTDDQPRAKLYEQLMATTYIASQERRPVIGWMSDLDHVTADDARAFYRKWYVPGNAAVVVVGNVEPKEVLTLAQKYYGAAPAVDLPVRKATQEPKQQGPRRIVLRDRAEQPVLIMAYKTPALTNLQSPTTSDREALALMALSEVLSGYEGARLDRALTRGANRVADSADAGASTGGRSGNGLFFLSGVPATGKTNAELELGLRAAVQAVADKGITAQELKRVVTQWSAATVYGQDSMMAQANDLGSNWVEGLPLNATERTIELLRQVTPEQVQAVAKKYFSDDALTVAELIPQATDSSSTDQAKPHQSANDAAPAGEIK